MEKKYFIGIDEAGRGPLAGPVAVAAVLCFPHFDAGRLVGIRDSKQLSPQKRALWFEKAVALKSEGFIDFAISFSGEKIIDKKGIVHAIRRSLAISLKKVCKNPYDSYIFLDGALVAPAGYPFQKTIIRGDETISIIALASIIAKVERDRKMEEYAEQFPEYGFEQHKGYGTVAHYRALQKHGPCTIHRRSFLTAV